MLINEEVVRDGRRERKARAEAARLNIELNAPPRVQVIENAVPTMP